MATSAAAAAVARARRELQHAFFHADAVRPDRAIALRPERRVERRIFERWQRAGIVHEAAPGHCWLDVVAYDVDLRQQFRRQRIAVLVVIVVLGLIAAGLLALPHR